MMGPQEAKMTKLMMGLKLKFSIGYIVCAAFIILPFVINLFAWRIFVVPPQNKIASLGSLVSLIELKPRMEELIAKSDAMVQRLESRLIETDATWVVKEIRELAQLHEIKIKELYIQKKTADQKDDLEKILKAAGLKKAIISLDAIGNYSRIAHWMALLDRRDEVRIDSFQLTELSEGNCQLRLKLRILLRES